MQDDTRVQVSRADDLKQVFSKLLGADDPLVLLSLLDSSGGHLGAMWVEGGKLIVDAKSAKSSASGYQAMLELMASNPHGFHVESASVPPLAHSIEINLSDLIGNEAGVVQSIKELLWPVTNAEQGAAAQSIIDGTKENEVEKSLLDNDETIEITHAAVSNETIEVTNDAVATEPIQITHAAISNGTIEITHRALSDESVAVDAPAGQFQPQDQVHAPLNDTSDPEESDTRESFYAASHPELDQDKDHLRERRLAALDAFKEIADAALFESKQGHLGENKTLYMQFDAQESMPALSANTESGSLQPSSQEALETSHPADIAPPATDRGIIIQQSPQAPRVNDPGLINRDHTATHTILSTRYERAIRWMPSRRLVVWVLAAAVAMPVVCVLLMQWLNYEKRIDVESGRAASDQVNRSMDDDSMVFELPEALRLRMPAQTSEPPRTSAGASSEATDESDAHSKSKSAWKSQYPVIVLSGVQLHEIKTQMDAAAQMVAHGHMQEGAGLLSAELQRYPQDATLRIAAINAYMGLKDYATVKSLCLDGMRYAQNRNEYLTFSNLLRHTPDPAKAPDRNR